MAVSLSSADLSPAEFLRLAGHPLRWRILSELARSDRGVGELTGLADEPQNLVSYHLGKLRAARLVTARRSAADRRDTYYGLDLDRFGRLLSATGGALHPGLRLVPPPSGEVPLAPARVLFLCTGNSSRSPMAETLLRARSGGVVEAFSAGSDPKPVHPNAVRVMAEDFGLDLAAHIPRRLDDLAGQAFDRVITLCDRLREVCPEFPGRPTTSHWSLANPATEEPDDVTWPLFRRTAADLEVRVRFLLAALADRAPPP